MIKLKFKDIKNRSQFKNKELKIRLLKNINSNSNLYLTDRWKSLEQFQMTGEYISRTKINNRCVETVSKKSFNTKFKLSRTEFLRRARVGKISGMQKAIW